MSPMAATLCTMTIQCVHMHDRVCASGRASMNCYKFPKVPERSGAKFCVMSANEWTSQRDDLGDSTTKQEWNWVFGCSLGVAHHTHTHTPTLQLTFKCKLRSVDIYIDNLYEFDFTAINHQLELFSRLARSTSMGGHLRQRVFSSIAALPSFAHRPRLLWRWVHIYLQIGEPIAGGGGIIR